jgi:hypothetical protein
VDPAIYGDQIIQEYPDGRRFLLDEEGREVKEIEPAPRTRLLPPPAESS